MPLVLAQREERGINTSSGDDVNTDVVAGVDVPLGSRDEDVLDEINSLRLRKRLLVDADLILVSNLSTAQIRRSIKRAMADRDFSKTRETMS